MNKCPDFNSERWKALEAKLGELETYKIWVKYEGDLSAMPSPEMERKAITEALKHVDKIPDAYIPEFKRDPLTALKQIAEQLNSGDLTRVEARQTFGRDISNIAKELYPNVKPGETYLLEDKLAAKNDINPFYSNLGKLQSEGLVGKRESSFTYRVDPDEANPVAQEEKAYRAAQILNSKSGKEVVQVVQIGEGFGIKVNPEIERIMNNLSTEDRQAYNQYLVDNLYTDKDHPTTTELLNNSALMSKDLKRDDLTNMARLIYKYIGTNPSLTVDMENEFEDPDMEKAKAYYSVNGNVISFSRANFGSGSLESEVETVLHEFTHALTIQPWVKTSLSDNETNFKNTVESYYNHFKSIGKSSLYQFKNPQEFLVAALNESKFKDYLKTLETPKQENFFKSFMRGVLNAFLRLFGIKPDSKIVDKIETSNFETSLLKATADYLSNLDPKDRGNYLKEPGRDYGLSFAVTAEGDFLSERDKLKDKFTPEMQRRIESIVNKSITAIKSFSSRIKSAIPESQEEFKSIFRQFRKLEEPDYNIDQVGFFFDFTSDIGALMSSVTDKIERLGEDENVTDPDFKLKEYDKIITAIRNFDPILDEIKSVQNSFRKLGAKEIDKDIDGIILNRSKIETAYSEGIFPLVTDKFTDILDTGSKKAVNISSDRIKDLQKSLDLARKNGNETRVKERQRQIDAEKEKMNKNFVQNGDKIESWLRGQMGDSDIGSTWMLAGISNRNPIIAGLSKFIRDTRNEISPRILDIQNKMQQQVERYAKESDRSKNDIKGFNSPLLQTYQTIEGKNADGTYEKSTKYALLNPFTGGHIPELQKFTRDYQHLRQEKEKLENDPESSQKDIDDLVSKMKDIKEAQRQFKRDYMEQEFKPEVHTALDMIYKNLGGFTAHDYMRDKFDTVSDIQERIDQSTNPDEIDRLYDQLDDANFEIRRLSSLYGKSTDSKEFAVAQLIKDRNKLLNEYSNFVLTDKGKVKFDTDMARLKRRFEKNEITKDQYERELENNTVTELSKEYWTAKKSILASMHDLLTKLGAKTEKNEEISKLYSDMEDIVKAHRDGAGIINGREMTDQELKDVKSTEEAIERAKDKIPSLMGLTKLEKMELSNLYSQLDEIAERSLFERDPQSADQLETQRQIISDKINQIESKKKKVDKKLINQYYSLLGQLAKLDTSSVTGYYQEELAEQTEQEKWKVDVTKIPNSFYSDGVKYQKVGEDWSSITAKGITKVDLTKAQDAYRSLMGAANLASSDWWQTNHITKFKWVKSENFDVAQPSTYEGEWKEVEEPTYAWRQTRPTDKKYILDNQPSIKYKKRIFKDEFKNPDYKLGVTGDIQPKMKGAKDDRYVNKEYARLSRSSNPKDIATMAMLRHLTDTHLSAQESIPFSRRPGYDLPSMRRDTVERFLSSSLTENKDNLIEHLGQIARLWKDDIARNPQDQDILFGYHDDTSGIVPMKFLGKIDSEDQSIDLPKIIMAFKIASMEREQLQKVLPFASAVKDIISDPKNKPAQTKKGVIQTVKSKFLPKNVGMAKRSSVNNTALQVNEIIKSEIYGEKVKDTPVTKLVNTTLGVGAKLLLGFNFISSVQNYANAFTQSIMETESNISGNFTLKNYGNAQKAYWSNVHDFMSDIGKYGNKSLYTQMFDYFGGINMKIIASDSKSLVHSKVREFVGSLSVPNQITEHMLNAQLAMAVLDNYRVEATIDGKKTMQPIHQAFTLDKGELKIKSGYTVTEEDRKEITSRLNSSARRINGEYGDGILAQKYVLGQMALFMNRYAIPFIVKRYGGRQFDIQDGVREEGYWRLLGKTIVNDVKTKSVPIIGGWKYYTKEEKNAVVRASTEFGFTVMFFLAMNALGGQDDRHLKDNGLLANEMIYALKGIQQQNEAFMPVPGVGFDDLLRKVQNPFPILGKLKNAVSLIQDASHALYYEMGLPGVDENDVFYTKAQGWHKPGDLKIMSDLQKLLAIPYRIMQYANPDQAIKNADTISRIK